MPPYLKRSLQSPYKVMELPRVGVGGNAHFRISSLVRVEVLQRSSFDESPFSTTALGTSRGIPLQQGTRP